MQPQIHNPIGMTSQRTIVYAQSGAWWNEASKPDDVQIEGALTVDATLPDAEITRRVQDVLAFDPKC